MGRRFHADERDREHMMVSHLPAKVKLPVRKTWAINAKHLDQGPTGTCVGHGWRNFLRCAPIQTSAADPNAFKIYKKAILLDPWKDNDSEANLPDGDPGLESGTTVRAGAKAMQQLGRLTSYAWAFSLQPVIEWLLLKGPVVVGVNWYDSMFEPDSKGNVSITPGAQVAGGHCFSIRGYDTSIAKARCIQSWGDGWGYKGDFFLSAKDLERLILENGEVCTAVQSS